MPNIKGIDLSDGIKLLSGEIHTADAHYTAAQIQTYLSSHSIAQTENNINSFLANAVKDGQVKVHIYSASPLRVTCIVADNGITIPSNWWAE